MFGPGGKNRSSSLFFVFIFFFWTYPIYFFKVSLLFSFSLRCDLCLAHTQVIPPTYADHYSMHLGYWVFSVFLWIMFPWAKFADPGVIKPNKSAYDEAVKMVILFTVSMSFILLCTYYFTLDWQSFLLG